MPAGSWFFALLLAAAMLSAGPARAGGEVLRVASWEPVSSFDPDSAKDIEGVSARDALYEGLVAYAPGGTAIVPRLAERWTVTQDKLTYTFTLRRGVKFHDGTEMTSADVKASFARHMKPGRPFASRLNGVADLLTPDRYQFVIQLGRPLPWLLDVLAGAYGPKVMSAAALAEHDEGGDGAGWLRSHDAGSGPFTLARVAADGVRLDRFDGYWGQAPFFAGVHIAPVPDAAAQALQLRSGQLDLVTHYPQVALGLLPDSLHVTALRSATLVVALVNPAGKLASDEWRKTAQVSINPKYWLPQTYGDFATIAGTFYTADMYQTYDPIDLPDDTSVARKQAERFRDPSLVVGYPASQAGLLQLPVELILANMRFIGIEATAEKLPDRQARAFAANPGMAPDVYIVCLAPGEADAQAQSHLGFARDAPGNLFGVIDPGIDRLMANAELLSDRNAFNRAYQLVTERIFATGGYLPLAEVQGILVHRADLTGIAGRPAYPAGYFDYAQISFGG